MRCACGPIASFSAKCRGEEAFDMLQAMNTGHEGSMATIHANTPRDAVSRLEQMLGMTGMPMTVQSIRSQISSRHRAHRPADAPVRRQAQNHLHRRNDRHGRRCDPDAGNLQASCALPLEADGKIVGHFEATGLRPRFLEDLKAMGIEFPGKLL
jgi:pilus assembly protein CpaF